jgi:hypothetical protein
MTTLPGIPLPSSIRSRYVDNINGLRMHVLEAGFETSGRPCAGHPRLGNAVTRKTWMAGTGPAMTLHLCFSH